MKSRFFSNFVSQILQRFLFESAVKCLLCKRRKLIIFWQILLVLFFILLILHHQKEWKRYHIKIAPDRALKFLHRFRRSTDLRHLVKCQNRELRTKSYTHKTRKLEFEVLRNIFIGSRSRHMGCTESITYTISGNSLNPGYLESLAARWLGPISFAIHTPGYDLKSTLTAIQYVRNCLPGSRLIRDYVSFHVYFSNQHMPEYIPYTEEETLNWPYNCTAENGTLLPPPYQNQNRTEMYKTQANMTYPINVGRNIARLAVNTHFIFACDIELYPSLGFIDMFLDMVYHNNSVLSLDNLQPPRVYPLPVFEIFENEKVPNNKHELMELYNKKRAQLFHVRLCSNCHKVPGYKNWVNETLDITDELQLFSMAVREKEFKHWEPFYVSDNREPFFDERVTWEGQSNKRIQGYAMCLLGYEFHVLHPAFLVHSPGIKRYVRNSPRLVFAKQMTRFIKSKIEPEYRVLYGKNPNCVT